MMLSEVADLHVARLSDGQEVTYSSVRSQRISKMISNLESKPFQRMKLPDVELISEARLTAPITRDRAPDRWNINHNGKAAG